MTDTIIRFDTEDAAKADPVVGAYAGDDGWRGDVCIPNLAVADAEGNPVAGWFIRIADPGNASLAPLNYVLPDGFTAQPVFAS